MDPKITAKSTTTVHHKYNKIRQRNQHFLEFLEFLLKYSLFFQEGSIGLVNLHQNNEGSSAINFMVTYSVICYRQHFYQV